MNNYTQIFIVVDYDDDGRILAVFNNFDLAKKYAADENGYVRRRNLRSKMPDDAERYNGYVA